MLEVIFMLIQFNLGLDPKLNMLQQPLDYPWTIQAILYSLVVHYKDPFHEVTPGMTLGKLAQKYTPDSQAMR